MTCPEVRDRLVERSLGALPLEDVRDVERHMAWCAGCRKEAAQLDRAAATFALTLAPEAPPARLEDRVVTAVLAVADAPRARPASRRGRSAAASVIAAAVAVSALGWGTAMAGRAERFRESAKRAQVDQFEAISNFKDVIGAAAFEEPGNHVYLGTLAPSAGRSGGGSALTLVSPSITDFVMVTVAGLPPSDAGATPYEVWIVSDVTGQRLRVGDPIRRLNADGGAMRIQNARDLSAFRSVEVTDASGAVVLRGEVGPEAVVASPSP
ncbi:MAG: zf-HC2 domain-containing protein [Actinomycetota bacterium]